MGSATDNTTPSLPGEAASGGVGSPREAVSTGNIHGGSGNQRAVSVRTSFRVGELEVPGVVAPAARAESNKGGGGGSGAVSREGEGSGSGGGNGNNGGKKPAWSRPNGVVESGGLVVMGADEAWPPLSESTKLPAKLSSSDSFKNQSGDLSGSSSPVTGSVSSTTSASPLSPSKKHVASGNPNPSSHGRPARQKSMKRDGGGSGLANGGFSNPSSPHSGSAGEGSHSSTSGKGGSGSGADGAGRDRDHGHNNVNRESGQRNSSDHPQQRHSYRRGNGGSHSHGDSSHQNYGGRRDQDRGNPDWSHQRNFSGRDPYQQSPRPFVRGAMRSPPPVAAPVIPAGPFHQPFVAPIIPPEYQQLYYLTPHLTPFVAPMPPMFLPPQESLPPQDSFLPARIVQQMEYYFSNENLVKDTYLRSQMDGQGWVPISLISGFKKMTELTNNIQLIIDSVKVSSLVEVQGDKIRRRDDWDKWIIAPSLQSPVAPGTNSPRTPESGMLAAGFQSLGLNDKADGLSSWRGPVSNQTEVSETHIPSSGGI
ncbi:hypothetical protein Drorol1_Dr00022058 [Drosera rotundifolia]